jgi:hypothetical protein
MDRRLSTNAVLSAILVLQEASKETDKEPGKGAGKEADDESAREAEEHVASAAGALHETVASGGGPGGARAAVGRLRSLTGMLYNASVDDLALPKRGGPRKGAEGKSYGFGVAFKPETIFAHLGAIR